MRYSVRVVGHGALDVDVPDRIDFPGGVPDLTVARQRIAQSIADAILPRLHDVGPSKELERDDKGQLVRSVDYPAVTARQLASRVGWEVAGRHLEGAE